ncbi:Uncharacterised protein [Mycobacteroides abscessus subsp. abscessus]|nr:Uncharacterised protein [Mycobacteroides abscessus subsp. abscessus]
MVGPTKGPTSTLASRPLVEMVPDNAVTNGWVASWAASGTASESANQPGSHRARR